MGFSLGGGGRGAHEALLARQEAEMRLMETMKRCLASKVKSDREYALALSAVAAQGHKMDKCEELNGSLIAAAWRTMTEEWENASKLIRANAETMESRALERLVSLMAERRKAKKLYQEDHAKISAQFTQLSEEVARKHSEYQKCQESYKQMRTKFEENYIKCPTNRGGRKLDETRDKYFKAYRRLHRAHNEYVLLLTEAAECERALRSIALPALTERQRRLADVFISTWKGILQEVAERSDWSTDKFRDIHSRIESTVQSIRPHEEYDEFVNKYKSPPSSPVSFSFDMSLIDDTSGKLEPNKLTVDNLTVDWLKQKLTELETSVADVKEKQAQLPPDLAGTPSQPPAKPNGLANGVNGTDRSSPPLASNTSVKHLELRLNERKLLSQAELIRAALAELGCEEAPSACPDLSTDAHGPDSLEDSVADHQLSSAGGAGERSLVEEEWFHGVLPREEVVRLLRADGDYLVRETTRNDERQVVLSVCWGQHKHFIVQTTQEGHYRFEGMAFPSVAELIAWQRSCGAPVTARSGALLRRAVLRERWELNNDDVLLLDKVGRGNFGDVYKAKLRSTNQEVAVKTCRLTLPEEQKRTFLQEGRILKQYDHPNIVRLIGIAVQKQPIMIVMELVPGGSLLTYLRTRASTLASRQLLAMCRDACAGMRYLESKNCIHRDLAARNCLVGEDNIVKISDFGMSREEEEYIVSGGMKQIPIKWTAPEALNFGKYTSLCDVWSYGILMWEIFSKGDTPYSGLSNSRAREKIDAGYRMPAPEGCPDEVYMLMLRCWDYEPEKRPPFQQLYPLIDNIYNR